MLETFNVPFLTKAGFNSELVPYYCGFMECIPGHSWGPGIRDHFLVHYIVEGSGSFKVDEGEFNLHKGQGFLIVPNRISYYQAHSETPWKYLWVGFYGIKAEEFLSRAGLSSENPVFTYDKDDAVADCLRAMRASEGNKHSRDIKLTGLLYDFMAMLVDNNSGKRNSEENKIGKVQYFQKAMEFIYRNYSRTISIAGIAKYIGIDRKYLHHIFKEQAGVSPQEFLMVYRVERACSIMKDDTLSISNISRSVGYNDPLLFSKVFKKFKGSSPSEYRKNLL